MTEDFTEFKWLPFVVGALGLLFLRAAVLGKVVAPRRRARSSISTSALFALWSFGYKMYQYGHTPRPEGGREGRRRSCRRCSATRSSRTSRCTRTRSSARTRSALRPLLLLAALVARLAAVAASARRRHERRRDARAAARRCCAGRGRRRRRAAQDGSASRRAPSRAGPPRGERLAAPGPRRRGAARARRVEVAAGRVRRRPGHRQAAARSSGRGRPRLVGSGRGSVVRVRAADVTIEGFDDRRPGRRRPRPRLVGHPHRRAARDARATAAIRDALFGIYLREAHGAVVEGCRVRGIPGRDPGEKGSGIHVWNTEGFRLDDNEIVDVRDGLYLQSSSHGRSSRRNVARDLRYGLHYMFSDDNVFEDNTFENGAAGTALMYSKRHRLPPQPLPPQPRLRLGGPALQGLRRRARRGQPDRRQRARHLPRGLAPEHLPAQRRRRLRRRRSCSTTRAAATASRATPSSAT